MVIKFITYQKHHLQDAMGLLRQLDDSVDPATISRNIEHYAHHNDYELVLAQTECGRIVGLAAIYFAQFIHHSHRVCRIVALVIDESLRHQGLGKAIVSHVEGLAKNQGCDLIELTSGLARERFGVFKFYEKLGYLGQEGIKRYFRKRLP